MELFRDLDCSFLPFFYTDASQKKRQHKLHSLVHDPDGLEFTSLPISLWYQMNENCSLHGERKKAPLKSDPLVKKI